MVRNDVDICHPKKGGERVLFHKHIFENESLTRVALQEKNLAPGEVAVARFYVNYKVDFLGGTPSYDAIRMIMAIGGATPHKKNDTYFFNDSYLVEDNDYITRADIENILINYYTKEEIDEIISNIEIPEIDTSNFATKEELNQKVDASYVENYFTNNVENVVNSIIEETNIPNIVIEEIAKQDINGKVDAAVEEKLKDIDVVTTETLDEVLKSNEYFTTNVITPISKIETQLKEIETQIKDLDANIDGEELEEWII